jgi:hypothetical protein
VPKRVCPLMLIGRPQEKSECIESECAWYISAINECVMPAINRSIFKSSENKK